MVAGVASREGSSFATPEVFEDDFLNLKVFRRMDDMPSEMAFARGIEANRTSHKPQITLAKIMRIVYTRPRQITRPVNILVIGIANPIDAKNRGRKIDSTAGE